MSESTTMPFVIFLECSEETMIKRINKRASETAGDQQRNDDNMEVLKKRFQTF
jgi:adenylate kinase family enzyme